MPGSHAWANAIKAQIESTIQDTFEDETRNDVESTEYCHWFLTRPQLSRIWRSSPLDAFHKLLPALQDEDLLFDHVQILSILVYIDLKDWSNVPKLIEDGFSDARLPYNHDELRTRWLCRSRFEPRIARKFYEEQFSFNPVIIEQDEDDTKLLPKYRLPILQETKLGRGAYGTVTKVIIARDCLFIRNEDRKLTMSSEDRVMARKKFVLAQHGRAEQSILKKIRESEVRHDRIMNSFASVAIGPPDGQIEYNLFFNYAPSDLQKFLNGANYDEINISINDITPFELLRQVHGLSAALGVLHRYQRLYHRDLKPDNILIRRRPDHPMGLWVITDFGIACFDPQVWRTPGDAIRSAYEPQSTNIQSSYADTSQAQQSGDVWSLASILIYVLVYAAGGSKGVDILKGLIGDDSRNGRVYTVDSCIPRILPSVANLLNNLHGQIGGWFEDACKVAFETLALETVNDNSANDIATRLEKVMTKASHTNVWTDCVLNAHSRLQKLLESPDRHQLGVPNQRLPQSVTSPSMPLYTHGISGHQTSVQIRLNDKPLPKTEVRPPHHNFNMEEGVSSDTTPRSISITSTALPSQAYQVSVDLRWKKGDCLLHAASCGTKIGFIGSTGAFYLDSYDLSLPGPQPKPVPQSGESWDTVLVSHDLMLLSKRASKHDSNPKLSLRAIPPGTAIACRDDWPSQEYRLGSVDRIDLSTSNRVALRFMGRIEVYDMGKLLDFNVPKIIKSDSIQASAFDPTGRFFVVTTWKRWYLWEIDNGPCQEPLRSGLHECTPHDHGSSDCSITISPDGTYFLLHDRGDQLQCTCIVTVGEKIETEVNSVSFQLSAPPKFMMITPQGDNLVYVGYSNGYLKKRCSLYSRPILNYMVRGSDQVPAFASSCTKIRKLESVKSEDDTRVTMTIIQQNHGPVAIVASQPDIIECVPIPNRT